MIERAFILSIEILAIYVLLQQGMILGWFRIIMANIFDLMFEKKWSRYLQKPLWDCFTCMSSVWTIILTLSFNIRLMLIVCGLNFIIEKSLNLEDERVIGS